MPGWTAKQFQLKGHNFKTTAIKFNDNRIALCYHGSTIWKGVDSWEEFIESDWQAVWDKGTICEFKDLPKDMQIECPSCGFPRKQDDIDCAKCHIIFEKFKSAPPETVIKKPAKRKKPAAKEASNTFTYAVVGIILLIISAVIIFYFTTRPSDENMADKSALKVAAQPASDDSDSSQAQQINRHKEPEDYPEPEIFPEPAEKKIIATNQNYEFNNLEKNYHQIKADLETEYKALLQEQLNLISEKEKISSAEEKEVVNQKINRLNKKLEAYEKKRKAFNDAVEAYNARQP